MKISEKLVYKLADLIEQTIKNDHEKWTKQLLLVFDSWTTLYELYKNKITKLDDNLFYSSLANYAKYEFVCDTVIYGKGRIEYLSEVIPDEYEYLMSVFKDISKYRINNDIEKPMPDFMYKELHCKSDNIVVLLNDLIGIKYNNFPFYKIISSKTSIKMRHKVYGNKIVLYFDLGTWRNTIYVDILFKFEKTLYFNIGRLVGGKADIPKDRNLGNSLDLMLSMISDYEPYLVDAYESSISAVSSP